MAEPCTWTKKESDALKIAVDVHKVSFFDSFFYCTIILTVDPKITKKETFYSFFNQQYNLHSFQSHPIFNIISTLFHFHSFNFQTV